MNEIVEYGIVDIKRGQDTSTLVLAYDDPNMLGVLEGLVRGYKRGAAQSFIDKWRKIDVFIDVSDLSIPKVGEQHTWKRIIYECTRDNPNPFERWPDAMIAYVSKDRGNMLLSRLLNVGR